MAWTYAASGGECTQRDSRRARRLRPAICCTCGWAWKGEGYRRPRQSVPWPHRLEPPIWRGGFEAHRTDQQTTVEYTTEAAGERCGRAHAVLSAARETTDKGWGPCHDPGTEDHSDRRQRHARGALCSSCAGASSSSCRDDQRARPLAGGRCGSDLLVEDP